MSAITTSRGLDPTGPDHAFGAGRMHGADLVRALDITVRVMESANDRIAQAARLADVAERERASLAFDAAALRYDELAACAEEAGYLLGLAVVPDRPAKHEPVLRRITRLTSWWRR